MNGLELIMELESYWKNIGKEKGVRFMYRYFLEHSELRQTAAGERAYQYVRNLNAEMWCQKSDSKPEYIASIIDIIYIRQNERTPERTELGRVGAEILLKYFSSFS